MGDLLPVAQKVNLCGHVLGDRGKVKIVIQTVIVQVANVNLILGVIPTILRVEVVDLQQAVTDHVQLDTVIQADRVIIYLLLKQLLFLFPQTLQEVILVHIMHALVVRIVRHSTQHVVLHPAVALQVMHVQWILIVPHVLTLQLPPPPLPTPPSQPPLPPSIQPQSLADPWGNIWERPVIRISPHQAVR